MSIFNRALQGLAKAAKAAIKAGSGAGRTLRTVLQIEEKREPNVLTTTHFTARERTMPADAWSVKRRLGRSWFTRRLNPRTRRRVWAGLKPEERAIARAHRWVK